MAKTEGARDAWNKEVQRLYHHLLLNALAAAFVTLAESVFKEYEERITKLEDAATDYRRRINDGGDQSA